MGIYFLASTKRNFRMCRTFWFGLTIATLAGWCLQVAAQPPGGPGGVRPVNPLVRALDTDGDGEISAVELQNATTALKALDRNGDGKLTEDELRPPAGPRGAG